VSDAAPIAFVDTETLGLDPDKHAIWEVGLILYWAETGKSQEWLWQILLTDQEVAAGDPVGMEIGRFAERYDPQATISPDGFCAVFTELTKGLHLAGNVVSFDEERLRRLCLRHGVRPGWHYHLIDVENIAVGFLAGRGETVDLPWKSDALSARLGVDPDEFDRHTALADAEWARRVYVAASPDPTMEQQ